MLGYYPDELLGRPMHDVIHHSLMDGSPYPPHMCPLLRISTTGQSCRIEEDLFWRKEGCRYMFGPSPPPSWTAHALSESSSPWIFRSETCRGCMQAKRAAVSHARDPCAHRNFSNRRQRVSRVRESSLVRHHRPVPGRSYGTRLGPCAPSGRCTACPGRLARVHTDRP